ncbi:peptidoglycan-binding protein [Alicyclobacillus sp.]|uniref:L,D-transpeptidase family protein n=1 Tax=Alicyclobacillus sp. TaxID=61169 RepID=UPI0025BB3BC3|nr:peptidoglycan-binding protein [Alicyclobacillus sp.]MCL6517663.1 peptidoglycan-binding protein [Alicyclobacillus sp.]
MVLASRFLRVTDPPMRGPDVMAVQRRLIALGLYTGPFDGVYTPATARAVEAFQRRSSLRPDGVVDPATWTALGFENVQWGGGRWHITIDTVRNVLGLYEGGRLTATYPVATGKPSTPTPLGDWVIIEKTPNPGGPFGAAWMRLSVPNGGYGIHGTNDPSSIGRSVTHGCVRMRNEDVLRVYNTVPIGTLVTVTGQVFTARLLHRYVPPGEDVRELQTMLSALGFYRGSVDGVFGPGTEAAVRAFQQAMGLAVDGVVGPQTARALQSAYDIHLGDVEP